MRGNERCDLMNYFTSPVLSLTAPSTLKEIIFSHLDKAVEYEKNLPLSSVCFPHKDLPTPLFTSNSNSVKRLRKSWLGKYRPILRLATYNNMSGNNNS